MADFLAGLAPIWAWTLEAHFIAQKPCVKPCLTVQSTQLPSLCRGTYICYPVYWVVFTISHIAFVPYEYPARGS